MGCGLLAVNQEMENRNDGLRRHSRNIKRFTVPSTAKVSAQADAGSFLLKINISLMRAANCRAQAAAAELHPAPGVISHQGWEMHKDVHNVQPKPSDISNI